MPYAVLLFKSAAKLLDTWNNSSSFQNLSLQLVMWCPIAFQPYSHIQKSYVGSAADNDNIVGNGEIATMVSSQLLDYAFLI